MAKLGRPKSIATPEDFWTHFVNYKNKVKSEPFYKIEQKKGTVVMAKGYDGEAPADLVEIPMEKPLTMEGFENYLCDIDVMKGADATDYFENKDNRYADFIPVCKRVKRTIREDQITGGMVGAYNPSITQRINNLVEKSQVENLTEQPLFPVAKK